MPASENIKIHFRSATNSDGAAIQNLVFSVLREYNLEPDPTGTDADLSDIELNYIERGGIFEILETHEGEMLGTVGLFPLDSKVCELRKMYFAKKIRGIGLGKKTLQRMIEAARNRGFERIYLETNSVLKEAIGLYQKFGFTETDEKHAARCDQAFFLELKNESSQS